MYFKKSDSRHRKHPDTLGNCYENALQQLKVENVKMSFIFQAGTISRAFQTVQEVRFFFPNFQITLCHRLYRKVSTNRGYFLEKSDLSFLTLSFLNLGLYRITSTM